jgi:putative phosphoesterase
MKIGILSDTHGNLAPTRAAAQLFAKARVRRVFHCGDIGGMDVLTELAATLGPVGIPVLAVLGNVDVYSVDWKFFPTNIGITLCGRFADLEFEGRRFALLHSDDQILFNKIGRSGDYDYVLSGHTHEVHDYMVKSTRFLNPGTAGRGAPNTCAVLNLESGEFSVSELP